MKADSKQERTTVRVVHGSGSGDCGRGRFEGAVGLAPLVPVRNEEA